MNAYILEINGRHAAALAEDGRFVRIRNQGYTVGQSVLLTERNAEAKKRMRLTALASMAAGFALLLLGGFTSYTAPAGLVSLDVNPSIEYTINCFDRVLAIDGVNDDGTEIVTAMNLDELLYHPVDEAIEATIDQLRENGYLAEQTENDIVLSANALTRAHADSLANRLELLVKQQTDLVVTSVSVSQNEVSQAHALGTSAGKLYLIEQLEEAIGSDSAFDPKEWVETPVREIIRETKNHAGSPEPTDAQTGQAPAVSPLPSMTPQPESGASIPAPSENSGATPLPENGQGGFNGSGQAGGTGGAGVQPPGGGNPPSPSASPTS